jgi:lipopolysaccharide exporter
MGLFTQALSGVRWTTLSTAFVVGTELLRTVVLAHYLSPGDFGLMAMVTIPVGLAQLYLDLGVSGALIHRQDATKDQLSSLYWLNIISGLILFAIFWCGSSYVSLLFREPRIAPLMKVVSLVFVITPLVSQFETLLQKELAFRTLAIRDIVAGIGQTIVGIACAVAGLGVWSLVFGFLASMGFKAMLLAPIGLARFRPSLHFSKGDLKGYISFGLFQVGERSITYFEQRLDQMLLGYMVGAEGLGLYSFAFNLVAQPVWKINPILTKVAFPLFSKVQNDRARLKRGYMKLVGFISMVNAPLLIGLALVAPMMVPVVFGTKWSGSVLLIQILSLVSLMRSINNPIGSLQLAKGRADLGFLWHVAVTVATVPAVYLGARFGQTTGVAVGMLVLQALLVVPAYVFLIKPFVGRCAREYASAILKPVGASCAMGVLIIAMALVIPISSEVFRLATQVTVGAIAYLALMLTFHKEALGEFSQLLPRQVR